MQLRPYQERVLTELWQWFERNDDGDPVIEVSVGGGKSVLIAELCKRAIAEHPDTRILMCVHSKELVQQNIERLVRVWPGAPVGAYSASLGARQLGRAVTYATIGSVAKRAHELGHLDLVLVDECFVAGTLVETPNGSSPIELIKPGDLVFNAAGIGTVQAIRRIESEDLYDVSTDDGNVITCTGNHPFFTERGFVPASALERGAHLYSPQAVRALWRGVQAVQDDERGRVAEAALLLNLLLQETREPDAYRECAYCHEPEAAGDQAPAIGTSRQWLPAHIDGAWTAFPVGQRLDVEYADHDWHAGRQRISAALQAGHQQSGTEDLHRGGRELSCFPQGGGREEAAVPGVARVARVSRHRCEGARTVFNLQVCGHPSYFAGGYLVHNCHLIGPSETTQYRRLIDALRQLCPALRVVGWTGTAFRGDGVWLTQQGLFTHVAARVTMAELLRDGYLAPLVTQETATHIDTAGVRTQGGDYVVSALARATDRAELVQAACAELVRLAAARKRWLVFAVTVAHAQHLAAELRQAHGVACAVVSAETPKGEREATIRAFRAGQLRALVNVAVLTTGFDVPELDCIALLRATQSPVLYVQIAGRGMRTALAKADCIAEGQRVLTDCGLVPIESVTADMRVWDGVSFVRHDGAVCKGEQDVITYAGLTATPDHRVWTKHGWASLADCAAEGVGISVGGNGWSPVREADRYFRGRDDHQGEQVPAGALHWLRGLWAAARRQLAQADCGLSPLRQPAVSPALAAQAVRIGASAMHQPELHELRAVRRAWYSLRVRFAHRHGGLGAGEPGAEQSARDRPGRQRSGIQAREPETVDATAEHVTHAQDRDCPHGARVQAGAPARPLRRYDAGEAGRCRPDAAADCGAMGAPVVQAKRRVWDLLNAGPLHRFTCEGLIVSNCLWLDFTTTTATLGPVDAIKGRNKPPAMGGGPAPCKYCEECGNPNATAVLACVHCGHLFPPPERIKHEARADTTAAVLSTGPEWYSVTRVGYGHHPGRDGKPDSLRVDYWSGLRRVASEWVCLEHTGYPRMKASRWWMTRSDAAPPDSVGEALDRLAELREPGRIAVQMDGKYTTVVSAQFAPAKEAA